MKIVALLWRVPLGLLAFAIFAVLAIAAGISECRKKQKLGANYEGPLEGWEDAS